MLSKKLHSFSLINNNGFIQTKLHLFQCFSIKLNWKAQDQIPEYSTQEVEHFKYSEKWGANVQSQISANSWHHVFELLKIKIFKNVFWFRILFDKKLAYLAMVGNLSKVKCLEVDVKSSINSTLLSGFGMAEMTSFGIWYLFIYQSFSCCKSFYYKFKLLLPVNALQNFLIS